MSTAYNNSKKVKRAVKLYKLTEPGRKTFRKERANRKKASK